MKEKIYALKSGRKIGFKQNHYPKTGDVVFFTFEEWKYIKEQHFTDAHKDWLWEQKARDFRYPIIPEKGLTEPEVVRKYCGDILKLFGGKKE